jgi:hypothetical protein
MKPSQTKNHQNCDRAVFYIAQQNRGRFIVRFDVGVGRWVSCRLRGNQSKHEKPRKHDETV